MLSREGELGFSVRKLGFSIGVDPMTVLHHFGSREELLRQIADRALATVELPLPVMTGGSICAMSRWPTETSPTVIRASFTCTSASMRQALPITPRARWSTARCAVRA